MSSSVYGDEALCFGEWIGGRNVLVVGPDRIGEDFDQIGARGGDLVVHGGGGGEDRFPAGGSAALYVHGEDVADVVVVGLGIWVSSRCEFLGGIPTRAPAVKVGVLSLHAPNLKPMSTRWASVAVSWPFSSLKLRHVDYLACSHICPGSRAARRDSWICRRR
jgi:hypothetical protein